MGSKSGYVAVYGVTKRPLLARWATLIAGCLLAIACSSEPDPPIASASFPVARKGDVVSIPFEIPASASLDDVYVLAFKYRSPEVGDPLLKFWSRPRRAHLFLKVRLVQLLERGGEREVRVTSYDNGDGSREAEAERGPGVVNVDIYGVRRDLVYMEAVHFRVPQHGAYRFDIETVDDQPVFKPITSWLTVESDFSHFK